MNVSEDLSKLEDNREGVGNLYCTVSLLSGFPLRGARNDANSFLVKGVINATEDLDIGYTAVCLYSKLKGDTALNTIFLCNLRIDKLGVDPLRELVGAFLGYGGSSSSSQSSSSSTSSSWTSSSL